MPSADDPPKLEIEIDLEVARPTRVSAYTQGGDAHFEVDRQVAAQLYAAHPGGVDAMRTVGRVAQAFLVRAVRYLVAEAGMRQLLVIGSSISGRRNVHELAGDFAPDVRTVYVLFDPVMLVYAHRLLRSDGHGSTDDGGTAYIQARMRDVDGILRQAADTLDVAQPVAVLMPANLTFVRDTRRAAQLVDGFMDPLAPGSHLAVTHHASDVFVDETAPVYETIHRLAADSRAWDVAPRSADEVADLLDRLVLVPPGVVPIGDWRPDDTDRPAARVAMHAAVARKPG